MAQYGQLNYESQEARALKSITADSYSKDQAKNLIELNRNSEYTAQYLRKLQRGVDEANQNVLEQARGFISDIIVLIGGGGATGLDFGDLKYVFQAIGSLFGFTNSNGGVQLPVNLFSSAWHFFSSYIVPLNGFGNVINGLIDSAIAQLISIFGDVPIIGEAVQQLAVIITDLRDALAPLGEAVSKIFDAFGGSIDWVIGWFADLIGGLFDVFGAILAPIGGPINHVLSQIFSIISGWTVPFVQAIEHILEVATNMIRSITGGLDYSDFTDAHFNIFTVIPEIIGNFIKNGLLGIGSALNAANLFGVLKAFHIPQLPFSHIGNSNVNLLVEPGFTSEDSIQLGEGWIRDATIGHNSPGAAKATASTVGLDRIIVTDPIPVSWEQTIRTSVWLRWQGLIYTGTNPITMDLIRYNDGVEVSRTTLASIASPATNQPAWTQLLGTDYIIPNDGTDEVRLQLRLRGTCNSGSIWFDDADLRKVSNGLPQNWILNLVPDLGGLRQFIQDVIDGIISAIRGIPFIGGNLANLIEWVTGWREDTDTAAAQASDAYIGLDVTQKIVIAAATGGEVAPGTVTTDQDELVNEALVAQNQAIVEIGAQVEQLQNEGSGNENSGVSVVDPVEDIYEYELDPTKWQEFTLEGSPGDGWLETRDGQNITMGVISGSVDSTKMYRWIGDGEHTLTNRQKVKASVSRSLVYPGFGDGRRPHLAAYCRVSDDGTKWVRAYWNNIRQLIVDYRNGAASGVLYNSGANAVSSPGSGSSLAIEPGVGTDDYLFRIWRGNTPLITVEDPTHATDATQKGHGIGMRVASGYGTGAYNQYTAVDNAPAPTRGIGFRAYRANSSGISTGGSGDFVLPSGCLDTVERIGAGMSWDDTTQCLTIDIEGWYIFGVQLRTDNLKGIAIGTYSRNAALYKQVSGSPVAVSIFDQSAIGTSSADPNQNVQMPVSLFGNGVPIMYAEAGSKWYPGESTTHGHNLYGDANGSGTWFSCALLNRSTA